MLTAEERCVHLTLLMAAIAAAALQLAAIAQTNKTDVLPVIYCVRI
ncbi:hypothetical protein [Roseateles sp. PN1]